MRPTRHTGVTGTDAWVPAHHLATAVGIYGGTTPGAGLHYAAGYRRPMVLALCSAERVSRRLRPLIESGAVVPPSVSSEPKSKGTLRHRLARLHRTEPPTLPNPAQPTRPAARHNSSRTHRRHCRHASDSLGLSISPPNPKNGAFPPGIGTVQQTQFDDVAQMVKISDRRFVVAAPQDAIHGS